MKKCLLASALLVASAGAYAAPVNGLQGCDSKRLVVSIPTGDEKKAAEICHVNGLTFNLKYGLVGKPEIDFNFMGLKSGGYAGEGGEKGSKAAFAIKGDYRYTLTIGKNISFFLVEYKKDTRYEKIEMVRLVNKLNKADWVYLDKFTENTKMQQTIAK